MSEVFDPRFDKLPTNPALHPKRFAHDLAWGVFHKDWPDQFFLEDDHKNTFAFVRQTSTTLGQNRYSLIEYLDKVWGEKLFNPSMLIEQGYLRKGRAIDSTNKGTIWVYYLTGKAQALPAEQIQRASIFISYCRAESSALALLVLARLKEHGISAYLDMHPDYEGLQPGEGWHGALENTIKENDHFIVLIGKQTLLSEFVRQEIVWANNYQKHIYPVWHNNFDPQNPEFLPNKITESIRSVIRDKNAVRVEAENPKQYNAALVELLSVFGITP